jgi:glycosyltransferase involved in cell wall biosynthesis
MQTIQLGKEWFDERSGGLNRYYADLVQQLPRIGVAVTGLVTGSARVADGSDGAVQVFAPSGASLVSRLRGARAHTRRAMAEHPGGLLVSHFALYTAPSLDLLRGHPLVVHFHGPWAAESAVEGAGRIAARLKHSMERAVYRRAARFIVLSRAFGDLLERHYGVDPGRVRVVPGGVDARRFAPMVTRREARAALGWPRDRPIALVVRRLVRRMGLEDLVLAVKEARQRVPDALVLVAGRGPLSDEIEARCEAEGLRDHMRLLGFVPDQQLPLAYRAANLSIVPSVALEGFGLIVAESLAAGTPVVTTGVGGLPETLADLAPQCVVHEPGPRSLGEAIGAALGGRLPLPDLTACVRHARERFDWAIVADRVRAVYAEAA